MFQRQLYLLSIEFNVAQPIPEINEGIKMEQIHSDLFRFDVLGHKSILKQNKRK